MGQAEGEDGAQAEFLSVTIKHDGQWRDIPMIKSTIQKIMVLMSIPFLMTGLANSWTEVENGLSEVEEKAGWMLLFDGVDQQAHWQRGFNGNPSDWTVEDAAMKTPDSYHWLMSREEFDNFELSLTFKYNRGGNSGVIWRTVPEVGDYCSGPEYGILDEVNGGDRNEMSKNPGEEDMPIKITAACYDIYVTKVDGNVDSPFVSPAYPFDEWNQGVLWADGNHHEHWLNDQKVVDYVVGSDDWEARFQLSKFYNDCGGNRDMYGKHPSGYFGLQAHGAGLLTWFKNLKVRPFTPGEQLVTPTITVDEGEQNATVTMEVAITGASIHYTLDTSDPDESSPIYTEPLELSGQTVIKAVTVREAFQTSEVETAEVLVAPVMGRTVKGVSAHALHIRLFDTLGKLRGSGQNAGALPVGFYVDVNENGKIVHKRILH
jgi:hypothetical protein